MVKEVLTKTCEDGVQVTALERPAHCEYFITAQHGDQADFEELCRRLKHTLTNLGATLVSLDIFGVPGEAVSRLQNILGDVPCPVTWLEGRHEHAANLYGLQAWAISGATVAPVMRGDVLAGTTFKADGIQYCRLGGLVAAQKDASQRDQTQAVFDLMEAALSDAGMTFANVIRTWFYNRDMLSWYDVFNAVRTRYFIQRGVFDRLVPASTGIGCRNGRDAALIAGLLAVADMEGRAAPFAPPSPLQRPSFEYGSAFSRAVEFCTGDVRRLLISGTASIEPRGDSVHIGDVRAQIHLTLDVVHAILESRQMRWQDTSRAIAYFKHAEDAGVLAECMAERDMPDIPALLVHTDICRDNLLFELELDALSS